MIRPAGQLGGRPFGVLVLVAGVAGVRNLLALGLGGRDEMESMGGNERPARQFRQNLGHMTGHALAASAAYLVMRMLFKRCGMRPVLAAHAVAGGTDLVYRLAQHRLI